MLYNDFHKFMIDAAIRAIPKIRARKSIPDNVIVIVKKLLDEGWGTFVSVCAILALGTAAFIAAISAFLVTPAGIIAVAILAVAGYGAYKGLKLLYTYRWFPLAIWRSGNEVKSKFYKEQYDDNAIQELLYETVELIIFQSIK